MTHRNRDRRANSSLGPHEILQLLKERRRMWLIPTIAVTALAAVFALVKPREWDAKQALFVRQEAAGAQESNGRFGDLSEMRKLQETILELAKSRRVLAAALKVVGPEPGKSAEGWPSNEQIDSLRSDLKITPPKGAEFGSTEVFYLVVQDKDRGRAVRLVDAVCGQLQSRLQELRDTKAQSLIDELARSVELAKKSLDDETSKLSVFERSIGADLAELRMLHGSSAGNSDLRQQRVTIENEIRKYEADQNRDERLLEFLVSAQKNPASLIASPNSLLTSQPALRSLKDGLVAAQLNSARLQGSMTNQHPLVLGALEAERETRDHLHRELKVAIEGVKIDLKLGTDQIAQLRQQLDVDQQSLSRIASVRAEYSNLVSAVDNRAVQLQSARSELAEAEAQQAASQSASLISRIDAPVGGTLPVGPGRAMITLAGSVAGFLLGLGLVFLTAGPLLRNQGRRATDVTEPVRDWETVQVETPESKVVVPSSTTNQEFSPRDV